MNLKHLAYDYDTPSKHKKRSAKHPHRHSNHKHDYKDCYIVSLLVASPSSIMIDGGSYCPVCGKVKSKLRSCWRLFSMDEWMGKLEIEHTPVCESTGYDNSARLVANSFREYAEKRNDAKDLGSKGVWVRRSGNDAE